MTTLQEAIRFYNEKAAARIASAMLGKLDHTVDEEVCVSLAEFADELLTAKDAELDRLRAAVEYYADGMRWRCNLCYSRKHRVAGTECPRDFWVSDGDNGYSIAQAALQPAQAGDEMLDTSG